MRWRFWKREKPPEEHKGPEGEQTPPPPAETPEGREDVEALFSVWEEDKAPPPTVEELEEWREGVPQEVRRALEELREEVEQLEERVRSLTLG